LKAFGPGGIPSGSELGGPEVYRGNASCKVTTPRVYPLAPTITFASNEPPMHNTAIDIFGYCTKILTMHCKGRRLECSIGAADGC